MATSTSQGGWAGESSSSSPGYRSGGHAPPSGESDRGFPEPDFEFRQDTVVVDLGTAWKDPSKGSDAKKWAVVALLLVVVAVGGYFVVTAPKNGATAAMETPQATPKTDLSALTPDAFYKKARSYYAKKDYERAAREANDALEMFRNTKGTTPAKLKEVEQFARKANAQAGLKILNDSAAAYKKKNYNAALNLAEQALDVFQKHNAGKKEVAKAYAAVGRAQKKVGNLAEAEENFRAAIQADPSVGAYRTELSQVRNAMAPEPAYEPETVEQPSIDGGSQNYPSSNYHYQGRSYPGAPPPPPPPPTAGHRPPPPPPFVRRKPPPPRRKDNVLPSYKTY